MKSNFIKISLLLLIIVSVSFAAGEHKVTSPDGHIVFLFSLRDGVPTYEVIYGDEEIISPSTMSFKFKNQPALSKI